MKRVLIAMLLTVFAATAALNVTGCKADVDDDGAEIKVGD